MEKIEAYRLTNGDIVEGLEKAKTMQKELDLKESIRGFANEHCTYQEYNDAVYDAIYENAEEIYRILSLRFKD